MLLASSKPHIMILELLAKQCDVESCEHIVWEQPFAACSLINGQAASYRAEKGWNLTFKVKKDQVAQTMI